MTLPVTTHTSGARTRVIDRRAFLGTVAGSLLAEPLAAQAQPAGKVYRIGYLSASSGRSNPRILEAFRQGLRELGWVEGQNIAIEYRWAEGRFDRLVSGSADNWENARGDNPSR